MKSWRVHCASSSSSRCQRSGAREGAGAAAPTFCFAGPGATGAGVGADSAGAGGVAASWGGFAAGTACVPRAGPGRGGSALISTGGLLADGVSALRGIAEASSEPAAADAPGVASALVAFDGGSPPAGLAGVGDEIVLAGAAFEADWPVLSKMLLDPGSRSMRQIIAVANATVTRAAQTINAVARPRRPGPLAYTGCAGSTLAATASRRAEGVDEAASYAGGGGGVEPASAAGADSACAAFAASRSFALAINAAATAAIGVGTACSAPQWMQ